MRRREEYPVGIRTESLEGESRYKENRGRWSWSRVAEAFGLGCDGGIRYHAGCYRSHGGSCRKAGIN